MSVQTTTCLALVGHGGREPGYRVARGVLAQVRRSVRPHVEVVAAIDTHFGSSASLLTLVIGELGEG